MDVRKPRTGSGTHCAAHGCTNTWKRLNEWLDRECVVHRPATKRQCVCPPLYEFHRKPTTDVESRMWLKALNLNKPPKAVFVCSHHFVDKKPTAENPFPELWLGYETKTRKVDVISPPSDGKAQMCAGEAAPQMKQSCGHHSHTWRKDFIPNCNSRVCSWHFLSGKSNGPTRFVWNEAGVLNSPDPLDTQQKGHKRKNLAPSSWGKSSLKRTDFTGLTRLADTIVKQATPLPRAQNSVETKNEILRNEVEDLRKQLKVQKQVFRFPQIEEDLNQVWYYTGLPDVTTVHFLESLLARSELEYHGGSVVDGLPLMDQLLMTLVKLKLNLSNLDLAKCFDCCTATVTNVVTTIICSLYDILYVGMMEGNIPSRKKNALSLPACFAPFPNCRIVLDYTEVALAKTEKLDPQCHSYSQSKGKTMLKSLIGVAPNGAITFVSDLYGVSTSNKAITADCGILDHLQPGDLLLADESFTIQDIVPPGVSVNIPSFLVNGQSTQEEAINNQKIASARIHVKPFIQKLKLFSILDHISYQYETNINQILKVCACLTNLQILNLNEISTV